MFGYVLPPLGGLPQEERTRFQTAYCGLCHTLGRRYGFAARLILNYDFTFLAILLSEGTPSVCARACCPASPLKKRCFAEETPALELAAAESVILAYWQLRDGVEDHTFSRGLKYRALSRALRPAYRKAAADCGAFDAAAREQLQKLRELERAGDAPMDAAADIFARLLAAAADAAADGTQRRILRQLLYHLGRWIYLIDAADDLKRDRESGNYNPVAVRYGLDGGVFDELSRSEFSKTLDHSLHMAATAFELWDFGCWTEILRSTIYEGLFQVGRAVLDGTFHPGPFGKKKEKIVEETI
ncbi:MAG: DUF5685 family protein [Oscillibacter sp.]|jgi:hypothetical protein|nr:DUF5685 family protein [Oscillibacter sp.]